MWPPLPGQGPLCLLSVRPLLKDFLLVGLPSLLCAGAGASSPGDQASPMGGVGGPLWNSGSWPSLSPPLPVVNFLLPGIFQVGVNWRAVSPSIQGLPERHLPPCHLPGCALEQGASCPLGGGTSLARACPGLALSPRGLRWQGGEDGTSAVPLSSWLPAGGACLEASLRGKGGRCLARPEP